MTVYAYCRVSTDQQDNGIDAQKSAINRSGYVPDVWIEEHASGKNVAGRPLFEGVLASLAVGDTLIVSKLDRFARSVVDAATVAQDLVKRDVNLVILDLGVDIRTPVGQLIFNVLAAVAEFERSLISQRTKDGMSEAKRKGQHMGRPKGSKNKPKAAL